MKKLWMMAALFAAVSFAACGGEKEEKEGESTEAEGAENTETTEAENEETEAPAAVSIEGTWQLNSITGEELTESEKSSTIEFKSDGTYTEIRSERDPRQGTWKWSDDKKTLITVEGTGDDTRTKELQNVTITADSFSFSEGNDVVTFKKIK